MEPYLNDLKMEQVSFAYEKDKDILKDVDILFAKGSKTAIIGRNGSGKTTIINLLTRMYEPTRGKILLGAENISELSLSAYRSIVSVVSQQIYLFNDTIRNNICLYKQVEDTMIEAACQDSGLGDFIKRSIIRLCGRSERCNAFWRAEAEDSPCKSADTRQANYYI